MAQTDTYRRYARGIERQLRILLVAAIALSVVHYGDNWINFDAYPTGDTGPQPTKASVPIAWVVFTVAGLVGYRLYRQGRIVPAAFALAFYSISGLISIGHYTAPGMSRLAWWRHTFIWVDIVLGAAILAFAIRSVMRANLHTGPLTD